VIKAALFDLDGTLYDRDRLAGALFAEQYAAFANELAAISCERFLGDVHAMDEHGHGDKEAGYRALVRAWGFDESLAERLIAHFWATYDGHCRLTGDARHTLDELRGRGLKLGVITNRQGARQRRKLAALGLERDLRRRPRIAGRRRVEARSGNLPARSGALRRDGESGIVRLRSPGRRRRGHPSRRINGRLEGRDVLAAGRDNRAHDSRIVRAAGARYVSTRARRAVRRTLVAPLQRHTPSRRA
jgi:hypothetical protein